MAAFSSATTPPGQRQMEHRPERAAERRFHQEHDMPPLLSAVLGDCIQTSADDGQAAVEGQPLLLGQTYADLLQDMRDFVGDLFADLRAQACQEQRALVALLVDISTRGDYSMMLLKC